MPVYQPFDWYETPLYYDIVFDQETDLEADFLRDALARHGTTNGRRILEPACGSGRLVAELARRGFDVTGIDLSDGMLAYARQRLAKHRLKARLIKADMARFAFRSKFDLAHCLVSSFKYLLTEADARAHLRCIADVLKPGGLYILGTHLTDYADRQRNRERWTARRNDLEVICNIQGWPADPRKRLEQVRSRLIVRRNGRVRRFETNWMFRTYGVRQLRSLIASVPRLEHVATYDFFHDIDRPAALDGIGMDVVLVLRRTR
jgi:SAM-dependent methyltransferase